jgi:nitrogenase-associated protein
MATIQFYEKPGCINNTRQKQLLSKAGHLLIVHNLLEHPWHTEREKLRSFFTDLPVADWFNRSAPAVKNGEVIPERLTAEQAIELMVANPLLIRRPLIEVNERRCAGFDPDSIDAWLGISSADKDLETCPSQAQTKQTCQP